MVVEEAALGTRAVLAALRGQAHRPRSRPTPEAGGTLTIVRPTDPVSLDPHTETTAPGAWVYYNILEPLIYLDEKMTIQPRLATSYEVMNPTKVRFKLARRRFDGTPSAAASVHFGGRSEHPAALGNLRADRWGRGRGRPHRGHRLGAYGPILRTMSMLYVSIVTRRPSEAG
jgi:hypothetical protein